MGLGLGLGSGLGLGLGLGVGQYVSVSFFVVFLVVVFSGLPCSCHSALLCFGVGVGVRSIGCKDMLVCVSGCVAKFTPNDCRTSA